MTRFREKTRPMLPRGVATFLPEATARKRYVEETILSVFTQWGYQEVIPPLFEYLDVITVGLGEDLIEKSYKFVDRANGRLMLLRPDVTPQIARMVAMLMADTPKPLRLCYRANVFRHEEEHAGRAREVFQIGGELVGLPGLEADAEMIAIAIESLRRLGLVDFKVALGHSEFFRGLLNNLNLPPEVQRRIKGAVARKDLSRLEDILKAEQIPQSRARAIMTVPKLFGKGEVIKQAAALSEVPGCKQALARLRQVYEILKSSGWEDYLMVDLSELRGFDYYTGMVFEVFAKDLGYSVGRGGRYDQLIGKFGKPCPSTGFAFDVEYVQWAWQRSQALQRSKGDRAASMDQRGSFFTGADLLLVDPKQNAHRLFQIATALREKGYRVVQCAGPMTIEEACEYAKVSGIGSVILLTTQDQALLINGKTGRRQTVKIKALPSRLKAEVRP